MTEAASQYRWNTSQAVEAFDQAAEFIHPFYLTIQQQVLDLLPFEPAEPFLVVDLGAGSGRLVERILERFSGARAMLVDQSEPFLALAERRLRQFGPRAMLFKRRLQDDWTSELPDSPRAIVSMSAIHHLDSAEKRALFKRCYDVMADDSVFINGDECRAESDAEHLAQLQWWAAQMNAAEERGLIPASFKPVFEAWYDRNIRRFGKPKTSGDDCHETIATQIGYLRDAGFYAVDVAWSEKLWAVIAARKALPH